MPEPLFSPDGRYLIVRGRLWRTTNPHLDPALRDQLVHELMSARRAKSAALRSGDPHARQQARQSVDRAKRSLGERGPVWWTDGAPDLNRHLIKNTPYATWYQALEASQGLPASAEE